MPLNLPPELESKLARIAAERGCDADALAREAIERFLDYDAWFVQEVNKGLAAADRGDFIEHDDVRKLIDSRYPG
jgi:predicted transcriptional regulator